MTLAVAVPGKVPAGTVTAAGPPVRAQIPAGPVTPGGPPERALAANPAVAVPVGPGVADFAACYRREMPGVIWFVMSLGGSAEEAADAAQSAFAAAFTAWETIRHPAAWLRRVAQRAYYRQAASREIPVETAPDLPGPLSVSATVEFRDEAREVLAALAELPARQRQVMAWYVDGFTPAEIARRLGADPAAVRQSLAKARSNLKHRLAVTGRCPR
jgi:RNA polymerase sigma factor (sigma-70 family)